MSNQSLPTKWLCKWSWTESIQIINWPKVDILFQNSNLTKPFIVVMFLNYSAFNVLQKGKYFYEAIIIFFLSFFILFKNIFILFWAFDVLLTLCRPPVTTNSPTPLSSVEFIIIINLHFNISWVHKRMKEWHNWIQRKRTS